MCCDVLVFWDATIFCNHTAKFILPQTKIWEGRTNISQCVFKALFKGVITAFGLQNVEMCFEHALWNVCSAFPNLRLGENKLGSMITKDSSNMRCDVLVCWFFWDAMIFCNNFARWLQNIVACDAMRCVGFSAMLWFFVTTSCSPNEDFGRKIKDEMRIFDWLFNGSSPKSSTPRLKSDFFNFATEPTHRITCDAMSLYHLANLWQFKVG